MRVLLGWPGRVNRAPVGSGRSCKRGRSTFDNCRYMGAWSARTLDGDDGGVAGRRRRGRRRSGRHERRAGRRSSRRERGADRRVRRPRRADLAPALRRGGSRRAAFLAPRGARAVRRARRLLRARAVGRLRMGLARAGRAAADRPGAAGARPGDRAGHGRVRPADRVPRLDVAGRDDRRRRPGAGQGSGRRAGPPGAARGRRPVPAAGGGAAGGERGRGGRRRGGHAPPRLGARRPADVRAPRPAARLRPVPHEGAPDRVGPRASCARKATAACESATIARCGPDWAPTGGERTFAVDAVCTAYGFLPSVDLARALGCELRGDAVAHDDDMATSVPGVYVAGEASGVGGADLAQVEGELAGWMAAAHARERANGNGRQASAVGDRRIPIVPRALRATRARSSRASPASSASCSTRGPACSRSPGRTRSCAAART